MGKTCTFVQLRSVQTRPAVAHRVLSLRKVHSHTDPAVRSVRLSQTCQRLGGVTASRGGGVRPFICTEGASEPAAWIRKQFRI